MEMADFLKVITSDENTTSDGDGDDEYLLRRGHEPLLQSLNHFLVDVELIVKIGKYFLEFLVILRIVEH